MNTVSRAALFTRVDIEEYELDYGDLSAHQRNLVSQVDGILKPYFELVDSRKTFKRRSRLSKLHKAVGSVVAEAAMILRTIRDEQDVVAVASIVLFRKTVNRVNGRIKKQSTNQNRAALSKILGSGMSVNTVCMSRVCHIPGYGWENVSVWLDNEYDQRYDPVIGVGVAQLAQAAAMIESHGSISFGSIDAAVLPASTKEIREVFHQIIMLKFPVVVLSNTLQPQNGIVVDFGSVRDDRNLTVEKRLDEISREGYDADGKYKRKRKHHEPLKMGPVPCELKVPELIEYVRGIIMQHAPVAHPSRCHEVFKSGVSLDFLMKEVRKKFDALNMIDKSTIARLLVPPRSNTTSAKMYKSLIPARVTRAVNNRRLGKEDAHFAMAVVSLFQELAAYLGMECIICSCDEKTSLVIGPAGVVSRYTRNMHVTPLDVLVDHYDHDYKINGYLLSMTGILWLFQDGVPKFTIDKYGRQRVVKARGGQLSLKLRSTKYGKPDIETNANDFREFLEEKKAAKQLPPIVMLTTDGGDGYCSSRSAALLLYGRTFRDLGLTGLVLMRRAGGQSSFNEVEHAWSPISKQLSGLILSADPTGDGVPCQRADLDDDEILEQESELFDNCMQSVIDKLHEHEPLTYNGQDVKCVYVPTMHSVEHGLDRSQDHDKLHSSHKSLQTDSGLKELFGELAHIMRHVTLRKYALVFTTCDDPTCDWIQCNAAMKTRAPIWQRVLKAFNGVLPGPCPSPSTSTHYLVFMQMLSLAEKGERFSHPDFHAPSLNDNLDAPYVCIREDPPCCKHWTHLNKTARQRHDTQFHMHERKAQRKAKRNRKDQVVPYLMKCTVCDVTFRYKHELQNHQVALEHFTSQRSYTYWTRVPGLSYTEKKKKSRGEMPAIPTNQIVGNVINARELSAPLLLTLLPALLPALNDQSNLQINEDNIERSAPLFPALLPALIPALNDRSNLQISEDNIDADDVDVVIKSAGGVDDAVESMQVNTTRVVTHSDPSKQPSQYSSAFNDFRPPPPDELLPSSCVVGSWIFGYWADSMEVTRGCVMRVPRQKRADLLIRFLDEHNKPWDYKFSRAHVFTTHAAALFALHNDNKQGDDATSDNTNDESLSDDDKVLRAAIGSKSIDSKSDRMLPGNSVAVDPYDVKDDDVVLKRQNKKTSDGVLPGGKAAVTLANTTGDIARKGITTIDEKVADPIDVYRFSEFDDGDDGDCEGLDDELSVISSKNKVKIASSGYELPPDTTQEKNERAIYETRITNLNTVIKYDSLKSTHAPHELDDEVMNASFELMSNECGPGSKILTTLQVRLLHTWTDGKHAALLDNVDLLYLPLHIPGMRHWVLVVVNLKSRDIKTYDSLGTVNPKQVEPIVTWLSGMKRFKDVVFGTPVPVRCPRQTGDNDCGAHVIATVKALLRGMPLTFTSLDMLILRRRIKANLLGLMKLNERDAVSASEKPHA